MDSVIYSLNNYALDFSKSSSKMWLFVLYFYNELKVFVLEKEKLGNLGKKPLDARRESTTIEPTHDTSLRIEPRPQ